MVWHAQLHEDEAEDHALELAVVNTDGPHSVGKIDAVEVLYIQALGGLA